MPSQEKDELHGKVSDVMKYYFGDEGVNLLNDSYETLIGDFLDPYEFYTTIEVDELKEYVINKTEEIKSKYEGKGNFLINSIFLNFKHLLSLIDKHLVFSFVVF